MDYQHMRYEVKDAVAWITKDVPGEPGMTNGMIRDLCLEMMRALDDASDDETVRVIVIAAAGDGFHGGGGPFFAELRPDWDFDPDQMRELIQFGHRLMEQMDRLEKPTIAVVKGGGIGGGMEHMHTCDFVIAADTAVFSQPETSAGMIAGWGGTQRLTRIVGWRKAKELLMAARAYNGKEAEQMGLITKSVPLEDVDAEVEKLIFDIKKSGPVALAYTKQLMLRTWETDFRSGLLFEADAEAMCAASDETRHAVMQLVEGKEFAEHRDRKRWTGGPDWRK